MIKKINDNPAIYVMMFLYIICITFMIVSFEFIDLIYFGVLVYYSYRLLIEKDNEV